ncbi:MAG: electron transfer flavoprotein subunit alpha/FixB family protein [Angelakisella sp.]
MRVVIICIISRGWEQQLPILLEAASKLTAEPEIWLIGCKEELLLPLPPSCYTEALPQPRVRQISYDLPMPTAEDYLAILQPMVENTAPRAILLDGSILSKELATRLAFRTGGRSITGVNEITNSPDGLMVTRGIYSCNLNATFVVEESPAVLALSAHPQLDADDNNSLETAQLVLAMGRGAGDKASRDKLYELAQRMGAAVGGTRPAALDGYFPIERMLGISGTSVKPELCITFGASGATPFMMGINDSKLLVAINSDPRALIFRYCDIGLCDSCDAVAEELLKIVPNETGKQIAD